MLHVESLISVALCTLMARICECIAVFAVLHFIGVLSQMLKFTLQLSRMFSVSMPTLGRRV